tara:strand:+ start:4143 stop:4442 length:300 start_codon:yes stop_codon:yes gene_type:complete
MKTSDIENTHKLLIEHNVQQQRPEMILRQVNMLNDYLGDIEHRIFRGPKTEELEALDDLLDGITYLMGFAEPVNSGHYADLLLHSDPQLKPKAKGAKTK